MFGEILRAGSFEIVFQGWECGLELEDLVFGLENAVFPLFVGGSDGFEALATLQ